MISSRTVLNILFRVVTDAVGWFHKRATSVPNAKICARSVSVSAAGRSSRTRRSSSSRRATSARRSFQRRSRSPATSRLSGSIASYCRCERAVVTPLFKRELDLSQSLATVALAVRNCFQRSFQSKWSNQRQYLGRYCCIDPHVTECDTLRSPTMIYVSIVAQISCDTSQAIVVHLELASAASAAQQSDKQSTAIAYGARHHPALHVGVPIDDPLVALKRPPGDIGFVMITNQHLPFLLCPAHAARDQFATSLHPTL